MPESNKDLENCNWNWDNLLGESHKTNCADPNCLLCNNFKKVIKKETKELNMDERFDILEEKIDSILNTMKYIFDNHILIDGRFIKLV